MLVDCERKMAFDCLQVIADQILLSLKSNPFQKQLNIRDHQQLQQLKHPQQHRQQ